MRKIFLKEVFKDVFELPRYEDIKITHSSLLKDVPAINSMIRTVDDRIFIVIGITYNLKVSQIEIYLREVHKPENIFSQTKTGKYGSDAEKAGD